MQELANKLGTSLFFRDEMQDRFKKDTELYCTNRLF